jgi:hypothetical protein
VKQKFKRNKSFDDSKSKTENAPRISDVVDVFEFPHKEWARMRFVGPLVSYGTHWIETKKKNGEKTSFPKQCLAYDPDTEERDSTKFCPWCAADDERIRFAPEFYSNAIIRDIEEDGPGKKNTDPTKKERKTGFKTKGSKSWTPVRAVRLTGGNVSTLKTLGGLNRHKSKKTGEKKAYPVSHEKYGCDVSIMLDKKEKSPGKKYTIQKGDPSPINEEQSEYLLYQIEDMIKPDSKEDAKKEYKRWLEKMGSKKKGKGDSDDDESDSDEDSDDLEEDDDEDDEPKSKNKSKASKKSKSKKSKDDDDEDEDDDEDDDLDDDEDDESSKSKSKKGKKSSKDEDDDDDEDEDDEPKSKKSKGKSNKSSSDDEDDLEDDEDLDDDDDDEDDEPKSKKSGGKGKSKKSSKKDEDEDDDDDLDDDDELDDDEEEEEKPKKKGKGKKADEKSKKSKSKKSKDDEDDEDEDDDDDDDDDD